VKIHFARPAKVDLEEVVSFISAENQAAARSTLERIFDAIDYLTSFPSMGRNGRVPNTKELIVSGTPFVVVYQIRSHVIFILRILHGARRWA
jgi:toxin ParE1/3/4